MNGTITLDNKRSFIKERDEDVNGGVRVGFGQIGNQKFFISFFDPERSISVGGGSKYKVGKGDDLSSDFFCGFLSEGERLGLSDYFTKEHWLLIVYIMDPKEEDIIYD